MNRNTVLRLFLCFVSALLIGHAAKQILIPQFVYDQDESRVVLAYSHLWPTGCVDVTWTTNHINAIFIRGAGTVGEGSQTVCDSADGPAFSVNLPSGVTLEYNRTMLWQGIQTSLWLAGLCLAAAWLLPQYANPILIGGCLLMGLGIWAAQGMPALLLAIKPFNTSSILNQAIVLALFVPALYWCVVKPDHRIGFLLGVGLLVFLWNGARYEYLLLLMVLIAWISILWAEVPAAAPVSPPVLMACIGLLIAFVGGVALKTSAFTGFWALDAVSVLLALLTIPTLLLLIGWMAWYGVLRTLASRLIGLLIVASLGAIARLPDTLALLATTPSLSLWLIVAAITLAGLAFRLGPSIALHHRQKLVRGGFVLLIGLFIVLKWPDAHIAGWLGFSYIAFRLLHLLLEYWKQTPLPAVSPAQLGLYSTFFSAQLVGPIDLLPHFAPQMQVEQVFSWNEYGEGWQRILWGAIKKFFIADVILSTVIPGTVPIAYLTPAAAWVQIYAYAFYLYCDFSGVVDIALGLAQLVGYRLPENFDAPYTKGSLALFWQSWHITLSSWVRIYVYLPLSRTLLRTRLKRSTLTIVLLANLVTMLLIGLWHGLTLNFILWGVWHAVGLFIHKAFSDQMRRRQIKWRGTWKAQAFHVFSVFLTFHFVVLGWVFFALPTPQASFELLKKLGGLS